MDEAQSLPAEVTHELERVIGILSRHGAKRILLYGSYARGDFKSASDLDLCVEGLPADQYFHAWAECLMTTNRHVSILDLADIKGYLRERILSEGKAVYARQ